MTTNIEETNIIQTINTSSSNNTEEEKNEENEKEITLTIDEIKEYSKMIFKKFDDQKSNVLLIRSINKIDTLPVSVYIKRRFDSSKKKTTKFIIDVHLNFETNGLYDYNDESDANKVYQKVLICTKSSDNKNMENCIKTLINLSQSLKFDNYQSKFIEESENRYYSLERKAFKHNLDDKECSICYENTTSTTLCDHSICVKCFYNLRKKNEIVKCPICRKIFGDDYNESDDDYYNNNEEEEDDDIEEGEILENETEQEWTAESAFQHVMQNEVDN